MAGGMKKFLNIIGFADDDEGYDEVQPRASQVRSTSAARGRTTGSAPRTGSTSRTSSVRTDSRSISMPRVAASGDAMRMIVLQPQSLDDTQTVIDNLRAGKPVIVNLERLPNATAQRLMDYVNGALYALEGNLRQVSKGIFLLAPDGVDVSGNIASSFAADIRKSDRSVR